MTFQEIRDMGAGGASLRHLRKVLLQRLGPLESHDSLLREKPVAEALCDRGAAQTRIQL